MARLPSLLLAAGLAWPLSAYAQQSLPASSFSPAQRAEIVAILRNALKTDPSILRDAVTAMQQQQAMQQDQDSTNAILANRQAIFAMPGDPVAGNPQGRVTLVEFYDVRCPYCRKMLPDITELLRQMPDVRLILKDLPVLGPQSVLAAKAMLAAQPQGGYLKLQSALMAEGATVDAPGIQHAAEQLGLNWAQIQQAMDRPDIAARIAANTDLATKLGIEGTPALVVGDRLIPGAVSLDDLRKLVAGLR